ncbi:MAG TPA: hypothetical protein VK939_03755 [Longimicrobiales bacterium]|nr:hypothetical protein [Longimicrobiales bacterium]
MRIRSSNPLILTALVVPLLGACDAPAYVTSPAFSDAPSFDRFTLDLPENPVFMSAAEAAADPNPWFPLVPGAEWTYEAETEDGLETTVDVVTGDTELIGSIEATVVRDEVYLENDLIELTFDWYAQDTEGNVWYLGEASCEWEPGDFSGDVSEIEDEGDCEDAGGDPAGSWQAGLDGAEAGIIMWADPLAHKGKAYRQEYYKDEAEDMAKVLRGALEVTVPAGAFTDCIETMDWTPLEPGAREHKFYCAGYGMVLEVQPQGGRVRNELVDYEELPVDPGS